MRRYQVTLSNDVPLVRTPPPPAFAAAPPRPAPARRHSVPRLLLRTLTGRGSAGSGGLVTVQGSDAAANPAGADASGAPCDGCD